MKDIVVDASVIVKWVIDEEHSVRAALLLDDHRRHAPDHWQIETANALWRKVGENQLSAADAQERMELLARAPIVSAPISDLLPRAFALATLGGLPIFATLYVALAEQLDAPLMTADRTLLAALEKSGVSKVSASYLGELSLVKSRRQQKVG